MRLRLTLILLFLNVLAFGVIFYLESREGEEAAPAVPPPILTSALQQSDEIRIGGRLPEVERILRRTGERWLLESPYVWPANPSAVDRLFRSLLFLRAEVSFSLEEVRANNQDLADYGLADPALRLTFRQGEEETVLRVGAPAAVGQRTYLLGPDGATIHVVDGDSLTTLRLELAELRRPRLFGVDFYTVEQLALQLGAGTNQRVRLVTTEEGWEFEAPIQTGANAAVVDARLQDLLRTPVGRLFREGEIAPTETGLLEPRQRLTLEGGQVRETFLLGNPVPGEPGFAYGKREGYPTVVTVPEEPFLALAEAPTDLRDRSFLRVDLAGLETVGVSGRGEEEILLQRLGEGSWEVTGVDAGGERVRYSADRVQVNRALEALVRLRAEQFVSDAPSDNDLLDYGLADPLRTVTLVGATTEELLLGRFTGEGGRLFAKLAGEPFVYAVPADLVRRLPVSPLAWRNRILDELPETARLAEVEILDLREGTTVRAFDLAGGTPADSPLVEGTSRPAREILRDQLRRFRVASYLSADFGDFARIGEGEVLPWRYRLEVTVLLPSSAEATSEVRRYWFTARRGGILLAGGSAEAGATFLLPPLFVEAWSTLLAPDRGSPPAPTGPGGEPPPAVP
jgi:hypothetical protein